MQEVRIDKWLWATRIFKTRSIASDACKKNRISINGTTAKAARTVRVGDIVEVRKAPITYSFRVLQLTGNRMGAKLVPEYLENITAAEQYEILELKKLSGFIDRAKGTGRPTKKDRRELEQFDESRTTESMIFDWDSFDFDDDDDE